MNKIRILLVDDDIVFGSITSKILNERGYEICFQNSIAGITRVIKDFRPNLILLDVTIGNDDGIAVVEDIHLVAPEIPVIFISSHSEKGEVMRAISKGAVQYFKKSVDIDILITYINRFAYLGSSSSVQIGRLVLDIQSRIIYNESKEIRRLSKLEYELLSLLYRHKNSVVYHDEIKELWRETEMNEHTLYNYIGKLRKLLSEDQGLQIVTFPDGYMLKCEKVCREVT